MPSIERETLHKMVDALPEAEASAALRFMEFLLTRAEDPLLLALMQAPTDDEPLTEEDLKALAEAKEDVRLGRTQPLDEVMREFGL